MTDTGKKTSEYCAKSPKKLYLIHTQRFATIQSFSIIPFSPSFLTHYVESENGTIFALIPFNAKRRESKALVVIERETLNTERIMGIGEKGNEKGEDNKGKVGGGGKNRRRIPCSRKGGF